MATQLGTAHRKPRTQLNAENARYYTDDLPSQAKPGDCLLNVSAICLEFKIPYMTFMTRQHNGWVSLRGGTLKAYARYWRRPGEEPGNREEETFLKSDVAAAMKKPNDSNGRYRLLRDGEILRAKKGTYILSFARARRELGRPGKPMAPDTLRKLRRAGLIAFERWQSPTTGKRGLVCLEDAAHRLRDSRAEAARVDIRPGSEGPEIRSDRALRELRLAKRSLSYNAFLKWRKKCPHLLKKDGEIYRAERLWACASNGRLHAWYRQEQIDRIEVSLALPRGHYQCDDGLCLDRKAATRKYPHLTVDRIRRAVQDGELTPILLPTKVGVGILRQAYPDVQLKSVPKEPVKFDGRYPDGRVNLTKGAELSGLSRGYLYECVRGTPHLPEGCLPHLVQTPPIRERGRRLIGEYTVVPDDLTRLTKAIKENLKQGTLRGAWQDANQLAAHFSIPDGQERIRFRMLLRDLRESGRLSFVRLWRASGGHRQRVFHYNLQDLVWILEDWNVAERLDGAATPAPPEVTPTTLPPTQPVGQELNETEQTIVDCVRANSPIRGEEIARRVGFPFNSYFRQTVANLVKQGSIYRTLDGYHATDDA